VTVNTPVTPPPATPPVVVIAGGNTINTISRFITLDASASYSPTGNTPLTFMWTSVNNSAAIINPTSPMPNIQLNEVGGIYLLNLTVTDSKGNSAVAVVTINFTHSTVQSKPQ
jgi:hypothetical protein